MKLFHLHTAADLHPGHPKFYDYETVVVCLCVWAEDPEDAINRAGEILGACPFAFEGGRMEFQIHDTSSPTHPVCAQSQHLAQQVGLGIGLVALAMGGGWTASPPDLES